jgi:sugar phosphate isomerase/epimerase
MKVAFATISCPDWDWETILAYAAKYKYDGIEMRCIKDKIFIPELEPFLPENIEKTKKRLKDLNLEIPSMNTSCSFHDMKDMDKYLKEGFAVIDVAHKMGVPFIRVFGDFVPAGSKESAIIAQVAFGMNTLAHYAQDKNVSILLELHGDFSKTDRVVGVMEQTIYKNVGVIWDFNHPYRFYGEAMRDTFTKIRPYLKHVHVKDSVAVGKNECKYTALGKGDLPVAEVLSLLKEMNFEGYLSLEWEKKWHPELDEPETVIPFYPDYIKGLLKKIEAK